MKILNLYAGIGGNRKLWPTNGGGIEITAVELDPEIAKIYQDNFPEDTVIVADAHAFLLEHFKEFDFIWSSPPCQTHSRTNNYLHAQGVIRFPDLKLYEEIIFLKQFFKGKFVVENVISYYNPLIKPQECSRHYFWANFLISKLKYKPDFNLTNCKKKTRVSNKEWVQQLQKLHGFDLSKYKLKREHPEQLLTNCVRPQLGLHVWNCAFKSKQSALRDY